MADQTTGPENTPQRTDPTAARPDPADDAPAASPAPDPAAAAPPPAPDPTPAADENDEEAGSETSRLAVGYPTLSAGSVDPAVLELTTWLQAEGADVPITNTVTPDVLQAVVAYRREHDIEDDPDSIPGGERARDNWIGPETWAAMVKARD
jgi:hypothetical protein